MKSLHRWFAWVALLAAFFIASALPATAQWQTPDHSVPVGRGAGATGFKSVAPGTSGLPFVSQGSSADPAYQALTGSGIASSTITGSNIAGNTVANSNLAQMPAKTVKCNLTGSTANASDCTNIVLAPPSGLTLAYSSTQNLSGSPAGSVNANWINISSDSVQVPGANFLNGLTIEHHVSGAMGNRQALNSSFFVDASPTSVAGGPLNYVAATFHAQGNKSLLGTGLTWATASGALFAFNPSVIAQSGSTNLLNVSGGEIDIAAQTGSSAWAKIGLSIVSYPSDAVQGSAVDAMLNLRNSTGAVGWNDGILISDLLGNAQFPIKSNGNVMRVTVNSATTIATGIDMDPGGLLTITGNAWKSKNAAISGSGAAQFAGVTSTGGFAATNSPGTNAALNASGSTVTIANGSNSALATGAGLILVRMSGNNHHAIYLVGAGSGNLVSAVGGTFVAPTTTPGAGNVSIAFDGSANYRIYNNFGSSQTFIVSAINTGGV